jgi:hypothetical protein
MKCMVCKGPFHPASGHAWSEEAVVCGPCIRHFYEWVRGQTHPRHLWSGSNFYVAAATSIRAPSAPK